MLEVFMVIRSSTKQVVASFIEEWAAMGYVNENGITDFRVVAMRAFDARDVRIWAISREAE